MSSRLGACRSYAMSKCASTLATLAVPSWADRSIATTVEARSDTPDSADHAIQANNVAAGYLSP